VETWSAGTKPSWSRSRLLSNVSFRSAVTFTRNCSNSIARTAIPHVEHVLRLPRLVRVRHGPLLHQRREVGLLPQFQPGEERERRGRGDIVHGSIPGAWASCPNHRRADPVGPKQAMGTRDAAQVDQFLRT
jgi:hypothetical protein